MKKLLGVMCVGLIISGCTTYSYIPRKELIKQSDEVLTKRIAEETPVGSSLDDVLHFIEVKLQREYTMSDLDYIHPFALKNFYFQDYGSEAAQTDFIVRSTLVYYGWARNLYLAGGYVEATWLFDKNKILKGLKVEHKADGI